MPVRLKIADFVFEIKGRCLEDYVKSMHSFRPFLMKAEGPNCHAEVPDFHISNDLPEQIEPNLSDSFFDVSFEGIYCHFFRDGDDVLLRMFDSNSSTLLFEKWTIADNTVHITDGNYSLGVYRYALWSAVNFLTASSLCFAIHSSANVFPLEITKSSSPEVVICLGESGTGKSTHTRLMREAYPTSFLLNDDSPFIRVMPDGKALVYGTPWSGKTPCYKALSYPLRAIVRLSQAPFNKINRLNAVSSIAALLPSVPPVISQLDGCDDYACDFVSALAGNIAVYSLECLPDVTAADLSVKTIFNL